MYKFIVDSEFGKFIVKAKDTEDALLAAFDHVCAMHTDQGTFTLDELEKGIFEYSTVAPYRGCSYCEGRVELCNNNYPVPHKYWKCKDCGSTYALWLYANDSVD